MRFVAKTLFGLEEVLAKELSALGARDIKPANRAVFFSGGKEQLYRVNYSSRLAMSVLLPINDFFIKSKEDLYNEASKIDWSLYMDADTSFLVVPVVNSKIFSHTGYPALILKDAIVDFFRQKQGRRPSVDNVKPDIVVNIHISHSKTTISLDSSVIPLYKRGYRTAHGEASLNEVLAAGMITLSGWDRKEKLIDPMCGSGTILIEAAMMAANIPAGFFRDSFGFMNWNDFDENLFNKIVGEENSRKVACQTKIAGSDISGVAVNVARENLVKARLLNNVDLSEADFREFKSTGEKGMIIMNPPYGERIRPEQLDKLYGDIGSVLKHECGGNKAWVITSSKEYLHKIGLKPFSKKVLFNGSIECIFAGYDIYEGSRKVRNF